MVLTLLLLAAALFGCRNFRRLRRAESTSDSRLEAATSLALDETTRLQRLAASPTPHG